MRAHRRHQRGVALFTAIFLIVVIALVGASIALVSTTQQVSSGRSLDATGAYYAARARVERELDALVATTGSGNGCTGNGSSAIDGYTTEIVYCTAVPVAEGGDDYDVFTLRVAAYRGDRAAGTLVRREIEVVATNLD